MWEIDGDKGNHRHTNCLTLAESPAVKPHIVFDWTLLVPEVLHGRFARVYLEKLPPMVLDNPICMQNLYQCLKSGGQGIFDYQTRQIAGDNFTFASLFTITVPPIAERFQEKIAEHQAALQICSTSFNTFCSARSIPIPTGSGRYEAYGSILNKYPELQGIERRAKRIRADIQETREKALQDTVQKTSDFLRPKIAEQITKHMQQLNFKNIATKIGQRNEFNHRKKSTLVFVEKP